MPAGIRQVDSLHGLGAIGHESTMLVVHRRTLPRPLTAWLEQVKPASLPHVRLLVRPADVVAALVPEFDSACLPSGPLRDMLLSDIATLVTTYARVAALTFVDVRLERVQHDACWKFHSDRTVARLITTYRGPGTEWVLPADSDRALSDQRDYRGPFQRLGVGDVAVFKGSLSGSATGIVHRSPPVAGTGVTRLVLCLNAPSEVSPDPWSATE